MIYLYALLGLTYIVLHILTYSGFKHHFDNTIPIKPITWIVYLLLGPLVTIYYMLSCLFWFFTIQINKPKKVGDANDKIPTEKN